MVTLIITMRLVKNKIHILLFFQEETLDLESKAAKSAEMNLKSPARPRFQSAIANRPGKKNLCMEVGQTDVI